MLNRLKSKYYVTLSRFKGVKLGKGTRFNGRTLIIRHVDATIKIGDNTLFNSSNDGYHVNMFVKCKLYADRPKAAIQIGSKCRIHGTCIHAYDSIIIGNNCLIAANTQIIDGNGHLLSMDNPQNRINTTDLGKPIFIGDNVWIGTGCIVLGGTKIGNGSVITAGSIVKGDVPPNCIFGGNPAKLIKQY